MKNLTEMLGPEPSQMINLATCWVLQLYSKLCGKFLLIIKKIFLYDLTKICGP